MKLNIMDIEYVRTVSRLENEILELRNDDLTQSDLQGAISAVIMEAIRFGYETGVRK